MPILFFSLLGGGRATKEQIALAIFLLFGLSIFGKSYIFAT